MLVPGARSATDPLVRPSVLLTAVLFTEGQRAAAVRLLNAHADGWLEAGANHLAFLDDAPLVVAVAASSRHQCV